MGKKHKGLFITLEGIEGAGKSTHIPFIADLLSSTGKDVVITREPGGTELGEQIRNILLMQKTLQITNTAELLLMFAARAQHLSQIIMPALEKGQYVLCDRFTDSTCAYQGGGRKISMETISEIAQLVHPDFTPDLTLLFDLPVEVGLTRARSSGEADRFESENLDFFQSARKAFLKIAEAEPQRVKVINAEQDIAAIQTEIKTILTGMKLC